MNINDRSVYYNCIYQAVVVNDDTTQDPEDSGRIQIYIPALHYSFEGMYKQYIKDSNKSESIYKSYFPWATALVEDLKEGNIVYCSFINNSSNDFIIIGKDNTASKVINPEGGFDGVPAGQELLDLAMPIILHNEVSVPISAWPDNISDSQYTKITPYDKGCSCKNKPNCPHSGGWSIGLIQWHHTRAFDCLHYIATADSDWKSRFPDQSIDLVTDLQKSISDNSSMNYRNKYQSTYHPTPGTTVYTGIQNMLGSDIGKKSQRDYASQDISDLINHLQNEYSISNPAIIIFLVDILNQYGKNKSKAKSKAKEINDNGNSIMDQLQEFRKWWDLQTGGDGSCNGTKRGAYSGRRDTTYSYIVELDNAGKLSTKTDTLVDLGNVSDSKYIPDVGQYYWPLTNSTGISCYWGEKTMPISYSFKYNSTRTIMGYSNGSFHYGTDFAPAKQGVDGDPVIAVGSGTVRYVSGNTGAQGNCIIIQMDRNNSHYFAYMHLCKKPDFKVGDKVTAGQVIGYMGTTGNSTGTHLHLGLHIGSCWPKPSTTSNKIDPLPYLGKTIS